jgi:membrane protease YdiL (CAAX protease family)
VNLPDPFALAPGQRLWRLEDPVGDFPFYNGVPKTLSGGQWLWLMAAVAAGYLVLVLPIPWPGGPFGALLPALLFPVIPLAALAHVAPGHWKVIFGAVRGRELRLMLGIALLNIVVSMSLGALVRVLMDVTPNAATAQLGGMDTTGRFAFFAKTLPQLLGEEVVTVLPFLAVLTMLSNRFGTGRKRATAGAWLLSSLLFGLIHLPTYDWNLIQCIVIIGTARMVLTLGWILTKNLWVSTGAHIINDWLLFGVGLLGAGLVGAADTHAPALAGTRWQLVSIQSMDDAQATVRPPEPARYTSTHETLHTIVIVSPPAATAAAADPAHRSPAWPAARRASAAGP